MKDLTTIYDAFNDFQPKLSAPERITVDLNALRFRPFNKWSLSGVDEGEQDITLELLAEMGDNFIYITADICMSYNHIKGTGKLSDPPSERYSTLEPVSYDMTVTVDSEHGDVECNMDDARRIVKDFIKREIGI